MITDEQAAEITMYMRTINLLQSNVHIIKDNAEMMESLTSLKERLGAIFEQLTDEERDRLLEQYKAEAEAPGLDKGQ